MAGGDERTYEAKARRGRRPVPTPPDAALQQGLAQRVERRAFNPGVGGSSPSGPTTKPQV